MSLLLTLNIFHTLLCVSIANFEHVIPAWDKVWKTSSTTSERFKYAQFRFWIHRFYHQVWMHSTYYCFVTDSEHGTVIQTGIKSKKIPCYMHDSACRWFIVTKTKIFWSYLKHIWIFAGARKCRILIGLCK